MITLIAVFISIPSIYFIDSYMALYIFFFIFCLVAFWESRTFSRVVIGYIFIYLSLALLNISTWRGYTDLITIKYYFICCIVLFVPLVFLRIKNNLYFDSFDDFSTDMRKITKLGAILHILISYSFVLYIYGTKGIVITNQSLRFGVPTGIEYAVKSVLPLAAFIPFLFNRRPILYLVLILLPSIMLGYRGTSVLAAASFVLTYWYLNYSNIKESIKSIKRSFVYVVLISLIVLVVFAGFYLRRTEGSQLATVDQLLESYFDYTGWWLYIILPFYLGFKETIGLSNRIITEGIQNTINPNSLFFADLYTVLPFDYRAAGQSLGEIFGSIEGGGLTPGLLGGIYIDYGALVILYFLVFSLFIRILIRHTVNNIYFVPVLSVFITQFLHLFHRGFLKPEYITMIIISYFYYIILCRVKL